MTQQRMPCSVSDGEQFEEGIPGLDDLEQDEDAAYEFVKQQKIDGADDLIKTLANIARTHVIEKCRNRGSQHINRSLERGYRIRIGSQKCSHCGAHIVVENRNGYAFTPMHDIARKQV